MQGSTNTSTANENDSQKMEECLLRCGHVLERLSGCRIDSYDLNDFTESIASNYQDEVCNGNLPESEGSNQDWQNCERLQPDEDTLLYLAGYNDCMNEAIRFLVEEEHLDLDHPVVRNLRNHLEDTKEKVLSSIPLAGDPNMNDQPSMPQDVIYDCYMAVNFLTNSPACNSG